MTKSIIENKEHRRFPRIKDNIFIFFQSMEDNMPLEAITKDISQGGLMFKGSNFIPERTELKFEIYQPLNPAKDMFLSMPAKAQVVWIRKLQEDNQYLVGLKIIKMNEENQNRFSRYINNRLKINE